MHWSCLRMKRQLSAYLAWLLIASAANISWGQPPDGRPQERPRRAARIPEGVRVERDLPYVPDGHPRQRVDLYLPRRDAHTTASAPWPLVIWIHGGAWRGGDRFPCPIVYLTEHGYAVASIGYRLSSDAIFPAQIHDCKAAIRFLRANANRWGLDPQRFGAWGASAGGHLAALVGTSGNHTELEGDLGTTSASSAVQAVCDYFGPVDLLQMGAQSGPDSRLDHDGPNSPESLLLGAPVQTVPDRARMANPITYIDPADPPMLIVHGDADPLVPYQQSQMLHEALQQAGVESALVIVPGGGHGPFNGQEHLNRAVKFFDSHLKPNSAPPPQQPQ
ncbi:MAG: calcium sensor EFh [Pirellulaceae bacterium]|nr:MAG: calcium sensor EFh [Pirellulaceae bacterium]